MGSENALVGFFFKNKYICVPCNNFPGVLSTQSRMVLAMLLSVELWRV